jgi:hypothetical protein
MNPLKSKRCTKISAKSIVGRTTLKMLRRKSKTQLVKEERNTQLRF